MNQNIIEHYKNPCDFISLKNFKIPFTFDNGLIFNEEQVYRNIKYEGILINKKREGFWISWYENGQLNATNSRVAIKYFEGNYKDGEKEGHFIFYYDENGKKSLEGNYKNGKEEGFLITWNRNGQKIIDNNYKNGNLDGLYIYWNKNGQKINEGIFKNGKRERLWISWNSNGKKESEDYYKNDILI